MSSDCSILSRKTLYCESKYSFKNWNFIIGQLEFLSIKNIHFRFYFFDWLSFQLALLRKKDLNYLCMKQSKHQVFALNTPILCIVTFILHKCHYNWFFSHQNFKKVNFKNKYKFQHMMSNVFRINHSIWDLFWIHRYLLYNIIYIWLIYCILW